MKLFLHAGLNKTGTSYLQRLFQANQAHLAKNRISYFEGQDISGNAGKLSYALRARETKALRDTLKRHRAAGDRLGCDTVLMSSELMYHDFILPEQRAELLTQIDAAGFEPPHILLFFREPVSHSISTYCHRSGIRDLGSFQDWVTTKYEFPRELRHFMATVDSTPEVKLYLRPYGRKTLVADTCAWLGITDLPQALHGDVNSSVNVGEAALLNWLRGVNPQAAARLRAGLKVLPNEVKSQDTKIRAHWEAIAEQEFVGINPELERLSTLLGAPMTVEASTAVSLQPHITFEATLSAPQLEALAAALAPVPLQDRAWHLTKRIQAKLSRFLNSIMSLGR